MGEPKQKQTMLQSWRGKQSTSDQSHHLVYSHDPFNLLAFGCAWKLLTKQQSHGANRKNTNEWVINQQENCIPSFLQMLPKSKNNPQMFLLIRNFLTLRFKNRTCSHYCTGIYFWAAHEPKVGYGLGAHCYLMMKHAALGGVFETLSSFLKPLKSVPLMRLPALISPRTLRGSLKLRAQPRLMAEQQWRLIYAGIIFH